MSAGGLVDGTSLLQTRKGTHRIWHTALLDRRYFVNYTVVDMVSARSLSCGYPWRSRSCQCATRSADSVDHTEPNVRACESRLFDVSDGHDVRTLMVRAKFLRSDPPTEDDNARRGSLRTQGAPSIRKSKT